MRVLMCPLSDGGYLYPAVAVGIGLRQRGHDVRVLVRPTAAGLLAGTGLPAVPADAYGGARAFSAATWFRSGADQYRATVRAARDLRPDVMVTSVLCNGVLLAAETLDLPVVVLGLAAYLWTYPAGAEAEPARPAAREWRTQLMLAQYHQTRELIRIPARPCPALPLLGSALLLRGDPLLEYPGAVLPPRVHHVGPCAWEPAADPGELSAVLAHLDGAGKRVVYVHLGRVFGRSDPWPRLNTAFTGGPFQAVVEQGRSREPRPDPAADILLVRKPWLGPLMDRAGLVLTTGTSAPVLAALLRGRPLGVTPAGSEQPLLAAACVRAGVAAHLPDTAVGAAAAVGRAWHDPWLRERARLLGQALAAADGPALASGIIENVAGIQPERAAVLPSRRTVGQR